MKTILFTILMLVGGVAFGQMKEVLMLEQHHVDSKSAGTYIYRGDQEPEKIELPKGGSVEESKVLFGIISKLYKEGWGIVAVSGAMGHERYIFDREKP